ncbi:hypothetical protein BJ741DRAFT_616603 [Chytriomyces cf. hyalinus JEL632]|nr:hypothetical protein BJ741DRAFT_616603 [Chytriomyces cf. hyalinus JEL632]
MTQTHTARNLSALLFAALLAYSVLILLRYTGQYVVDGGRLHAVSLVLSLLAALYLGLVPAAAAHGFLTGLHAGVLAIFGEWDTHSPSSDPTSSSSSSDTQPTLEPSDASDPLSTVLRSFSWFSLGVPAFVHALANVVARAAISLAYTALKAAVRATPSVIESIHALLRKGVEALNEWQRVHLPKLYPYIEATVIAVSVWAPFIFNQLYSVVERISSHVNSFFVSLGTWIHDSWDPVIVPAFKSVQKGLGYLSLACLFVFEHTQNLVEAVLGYCHFLLARFSVTIIELHSWVSVWAGPLITALSSYVRAAFRYAAAASRQLHVLCHGILDVVFENWIYWRVSEKIGALVNAVRAVLSSISAMLVSASTLIHLGLMHIFSFLDKFTLFSNLFKVMRKFYKLVSPYAIFAWSAFYGFCLQLIIVTKVLATPLIDMSVKLGYMSARLISQVATAVYTVISQTQFYQLLDGLFDWSFWEAIVAEIQVQLEKFWAQLVRFHASIERAVNESLFGVSADPKGGSDEKSSDTADFKGKPSVKLE